MSILPLSVIPDCREAASPESISAYGDYGFRLPRFARPRNDTRRSHDGKFGITPVGDQHGPGIMGDAEIRTHRHDHRLRRHSAGPEYRKLVLVHRHRIAPIRAAQVLDPD